MICLCNRLSVDSKAIVLILKEFSNSIGADIDSFGFFAVGVLHQHDECGRQLYPWLEARPGHGLWFWGLLR